MSLSEEHGIVEEPSEVDIPDIPSNGSLYANYVHDVANGGLIFIDKATISKQRSVLKHFIRKIGSNLIHGKSLLNVSFPVTVFQPTTLLQKVTATFGYAPTFLERAGQATGIDRFYQVVAFAVATLHIPIEQMKPFNPILGETMQGRLGHCQVYAEQTSHHPPVSNFQIVGQHFVLQGYHEYQASTSANSVKARQVGMTEIVFPDGSIFISFPFVSISGTMLGRRTFNWEGIMTIIDRQNLLLCELRFNPDKKGKLMKFFSRQKTPADYFKGTISRVKRSHPMMTDEGLKAILHDGKSPIKTKTPEVIEVISECQGSWPVYLDIAKHRVWTIEDCSRCNLEAADALLPSDSTYRSDLVLLKKHDEVNAQVEKDRLEDLQRLDRRLRDSHSH